MRGGLDLLELHRRDERALETLRAARGPQAPVYLIELAAAEEALAGERLEIVRRTLTASPLGERGSRALPLLRIAVELGYTFSGEDVRRYWEPLGETLRVGALSEPWRDGLAELFERHAEQTRVRPGKSLSLIHI